MTASVAAAPKAAKEGLFEVSTPVGPAKLRVEGLQDSAARQGGAPAWPGEEGATVLLLSLPSAWLEEDIYLYLYLYLYLYHTTTTTTTTASTTTTATTTPTSTTTNNNNDNRSSCSGPAARGRWTSPTGPPGAPGSRSGAASSASRSKLDIWGIDKTV